MLFLNYVDLNVGIAVHLHSTYMDNQQYHFISIIFELLPKLLQRNSPPNWPTLEVADMAPSAAVANNAWPGRLVWGRIFDLVIQILPRRRSTFLRFRNLVFQISVEVWSFEYVFSGGPVIPPHDLSLWKPWGRSIFIGGLNSFSAT